MIFFGSSNHLPTSGRKALNATLLFGLIASLSSCSYIGFDEYFRDRSNDYRRSEEMSPIQVPEGLDADGVGELYPVPVGGEVVSYQIDEEFTVPRPRSVAVNASINEVKIQRMGDDAWILMSLPPSQSWPKIRSYLTRNGIPSAKADASRGVIETGLFKLSNDESRFHQFLISLSQGVQLNSTEIDILQRSFVDGAVPSDLPTWQGSSEDMTIENWLRDQLSTALADQNVTGTASLLGQEIGAEAKVELVTPTGSLPYIEMKMVYERAWASVGFALEKGGFSIDEDHFDDGYYLSSYVDPEVEKPSFFKRIISLSRSKNSTQRYRLDMQRVEGELIRVRLNNTEGPAMTSRENYLVLQTIRNNLG